MQFRVLGPIEVDTGDGAVRTPGGAQGRALLTALVLQGGALVPTHRLAEAMWGEQPPADVDNAVHVAVRRLRLGLGPAGTRLVTGPRGYRLDLRGEPTDADLFEEDCRAARAGTALNPADAVALFDRALARWRGPAFGECAESFARPAAVHLEEARRVATEDRAEALLRAGRIEEAVAAAGDLVAAHPLTDRPVLLLMQSLATAGRVADALAAYRRHRELVHEELGLEPASQLRDLQARILREDVGSPVLRTVPPGPARLPRRPSALIGREDEVAALAAALGDPGLLTLIGPGGVGKTRLALELAHGWAAAARPVWWVDLVPVLPARVVDAIAAATGVEVPSGPDPAGGLCAALATARGVLVLDNAEHLLDPVAALVERLLDCAPGLTVLVTSRERLDLPGEGVRMLPPLPLPQGADRGNPAVRLFLARAPTLGPAPDDRDLAMVAQLCHRLDGLPLAIELGAARAEGLGLAVLADRLTDRLDLLGVGRRTADRRHRTMHAVVEWSHDLLAPDEAILFRRLGAFPATFTLDQVEAVCTDDAVPVQAIPVLLARLVQRSLVQLARPDRFRLLETLRSFATEQLEAAGDRTRMRDRHARDTAARLTTTYPQLWSEQEPEAVGALTALTPDLHAAWEYGAEHDRALALRLAGEIYDFAYFRQRLDLLRWGLPAAGWAVEEPELAAALGTAAAATWSAGRMTEAAAIAERGIAVAGGPDALAAALPMEVSADIAMFLGRTDEAVARYRRHAALRRARGEPGPALCAELAVAHALINGQRATEAAGIVAEALPRAVRSANPTALAWAHYLAAEVAADTDPDRAAAGYRTAIDCAARADSRLFGTMAASSAAALQSRAGSVRAALEAFPAVLDQWVKLGNDAALAWTLMHVVVLLARAKADEDAAVLAGAMLARADAQPAFAVDMERIDATLQGIRTRIEEPASTAALDAGSSLTWTATLQHARRALTDAAAARHEPAVRAPSP
ncbi:Predicted ATPase [Geodermatophilus africanus]|uniref:Predicted ATPase n=1 Tax=Geodermatophilus africanus TaxID=1137993 RepID=A0A1H3PP20_9ACTN|nr:BTAD domain-containing putative transcriptional regulator [Geodermatophilus africanus]SDZ02149.1 Predicted ATPase [Geodermatophilus africanus]